MGIYLADEAVKKRRKKNNFSPDVTGNQENFAVLLFAFLMILSFVQNSMPPYLWRSGKLNFSHLSIF